MTDLPEKMNRPPCLPNGCDKDVRHLGKGTSAGDWPCNHCGWSIREKHALVAQEAGTLW